MIDPWPGHSKDGSHPRDRLAIDLDPTNHLVLGLDQVACVQEVGGREEWIGDRLRVGMDGAVRSERQEVRIEVGRRCHGMPAAANRCQGNYAAEREGVVDKRSSPASTYL
jgi:hypothetical protein